MSYDEERGFVESVRRFFWIPRGEPRDPAPVLPLAWVWVFGAATWAGLVAIGWLDVVIVTLVGTVFPMLDDVIDGVRLRWPAFVLGLAVGFAVGRLVRAAGLVPADSDWASYPAFVCGSLAALVTFAAITRLPRIQRGR